MYASDTDKLLMNTARLASKTITLATAGLMTVAMMAESANAAPPPGADPNSAYGRWVGSLKTPWGRHTPCCGESDCRPVKLWMNASHHLMARIEPADDTPAGFEGADVPIPEKIVLPPDDNAPPTAVLCRVVAPNYHGDDSQTDMNGEPPRYVTKDGKWIVSFYCLSMSPGG